MAGVAKGKITGEGGPGADIVSQPSLSFEAVTPNDSTVIEPPKAVYIGTGGNLTVTNDAGAHVLFKNVANGQILDIRPTRIRATGTTAADLVLLY